MRALRFALLVACLAAAPARAASAPARRPPEVLVGVSAEFGDRTSTSGDAIRLGMQIAIEEVNRAGGVLGGRRLVLVERDNRGVAARMARDVRELAAMEGLVAVFCGKFSPAVLEAIPVARELSVPVLDPWAAADPIVDAEPPPGWTFRLSLKDSWAIGVMLKHLVARGVGDVGLLVPGTSWGRSNEAALRQALRAHPGVRLAGVEWFDPGATSLREPYEALLRAGAKGLLLVANESEGAVLVRELAALPPERRLPIASHWGLAGGDFVGLAGAAVAAVDLALVQTYDLASDERPAARRVKAEAERRAGRPAWQLPSAAGLAHAHDLVLILARAVELAGSTDRARVRDALERVRGVDGMIRRHERPFAPGAHEALSPADVFMARYDAGGALVRARR